MLRWQYMIVIYRMFAGNWMTTSCVGVRVTRPNAAPRRAPRWDFTPRRPEADNEQCDADKLVERWPRVSGNQGQEEWTQAWAKISRLVFTLRRSCLYDQVKYYTGGHLRGRGSGAWTVATWGTDWPAERSSRGTWGPCTGSGTSRMRGVWILS